MTRPPLFPHQVTALEFLRTHNYPCPEYRSVHARVRKERGPARDYACSGCGGPASDWAFQYPPDRTLVCPATRRRYSNRTSDYAPMCRSCHLRMDWDKDPEMAAALSTRRSEVTARPKTEEHLRRIWESRRADPEGMKQHAQLMSRTMSKTNSRKFQCGDCDLTTNAGNLGKHQRASGHHGRKDPQ